MQGSQGYTGPQGILGYTGPQGDTGPSGIFINSVLSSSDITLYSSFNGDIKYIINTDASGSHNVIPDSGITIQNGPDNIANINLVPYAGLQLIYYNNVWIIMNSTPGVTLTPVT